MSDRTKSFTLSLVETNPVLRPLLEEHMQANDELLPYLLMSDIARWAGSIFDSAIPEDRETLITVLAALEAGQRDQGPEVGNLVAVGFVESLPSTGEPGAGLRTLLPPLLAEDYAQLNW
jgi:hypothetical protein